MWTPNATAVRGLLLLSFLLSGSTTASSQHVNPHILHSGDRIEATLNYLTSSVTQVPYDYSSAPICQPGLEEAGTSGTPSGSPAGLPSPYVFRVRENQSKVSACSAQSTGPLSEAQVEVLRERIDDGYYVNMALDNMPVTLGDVLAGDRPLKPGYPLGAKQGGVHVVNNHLSFIAIVRKVTGAEAAVPEDGWELLGFMAMACSIRRGPGAPPVDMPCHSWAPDAAPTPQVVAVGEEIEYTYDVFWPDVDVAWGSRWGGYQRVADAPLHWFSVRMALLTAGLLACAVARVLWHTLWRDLRVFDSEPSDPPETSREEEGRRWQLVAAEVFRPPPAAARLAVRFGTGVQLLVTAAATLLLAAARLLPPDCPHAQRGAIVLMFFSFAPLGGLAAVGLLRSAQRSAAGWLLVCVKTACYFPGLLWVAATVVRISMDAAGASPDPVATPATLLTSTLYAVPLTLLGGAGGLFVPMSSWPVAPAKPPSEPPSHSTVARGAQWLLYVTASAVAPFSMFHMEGSFLMDSLWEHYVYASAGFLALAAVLTVLSVAAVSVLSTHRRLCAEDPAWWWPALNIGGPPAGCLLLHAALYRASHFPDLQGPGQLLYASYTLLAAAALYLALGAVSLAASLAFVTVIYARHAEVAAAAPMLAADMEQQEQPAAPANTWTPAW